MQPFVFRFNPTEVESSKKINYFVAPNIGGAFHEKFFTGFDNRVVSFTLVCIDKENPLGVMPEIAYFEQLSEPDPGILGISGSFFGNENYPPPKVLFQFGVSMVPLVWYVDDAPIKRSMFYDDPTRGVIGIPKRMDVTLTLSLDENSILFKSNQIAKRASAIAAAVQSGVIEGRAKQGKRKEAPGLFPSRAVTTIRKDQF